MNFMTCILGSCIEEHFDLNNLLEFDEILRLEDYAPIWETSWLKKLAQIWFVLWHIIFDLCINKHFLKRFCSNLMSFKTWRFCLNLRSLVTWRQLEFDEVGLFSFEDLNSNSRIFGAWKFSLNLMSFMTCILVSCIDEHYDLQFRLIHQGTYQLTRLFNFNFGWKLVLIINVNYISFGCLKLDISWSPFDDCLLFCEGLLFLLSFMKIFR